MHQALGMLQHWSLILQKVISTEHCRFRYVRQLSSGTCTARIRNEDGASVYLGAYQAAQEAAKAVDVARIFLV